MKAKALRCGGRDPVTNLALEEALLDRGDGPLFLVYVNDPCVVVGRNQNPWAEVSASCPFPVLRRISGGGTVYHDGGNLNWSFILPRGSHDQSAELASIAGALSSIGIEAEPGPRGGLFVAGGEGAPLKIGGTARRLAASRVIHHGTLLVDADLEAMTASLGGLRTLESRCLPSVPSPAVNLSALSPGLALERVVSVLFEAVGAGPASEAEDAAEPAAALEAAGRLRSWDWTWGATPAFSVPLGGHPAAVAEVRSGRVAAIRGTSHPDLAGLVGSRFEFDLPVKASILLGSA